MCRYGQLAQSCRWLVLLSSADGSLHVFSSPAFPSPGLSRICVRCTSRWAGKAETTHHCAVPSLHCLWPAVTGVAVHPDHVCNQPQLVSQELVVLVKAAVMSACGDCYQACGPINKKGEVECVPARTAAGRLAKAGLIN